jgi:hypothetical protein
MCKSKGRCFSFPITFQLLKSIDFAISNSHSVGDDLFRTLVVDDSSGVAILRYYVLLLSAVVVDIGWNEAQKSLTHPTNHLMRAGSRTELLSAARLFLLFSSSLQPLQTVSTARFHSLKIMASSSFQDWLCTVLCIT